MTSNEKEFWERYNALRKNQVVEKPEVVQPANIEIAVGDEIEVKENQ